MMKENKKIFSKPELDIIKFTAQDIIATSGDFENNDSDPRTDKFNMFA